MATGCSTPDCKARVVMQQCVSAKLQLNADSLEDPIYAKINQGIVVFICFRKGATVECTSKIARSVLSVKLSHSASKKGMCSVQESGGSMLIVPQACIGGKLKGKSVQYHDLCGKEEGQVLYCKFVEDCKELSKGTETLVLSGTYGNRQVLAMDTEGPFTHIFDF